LCKKLRHDLPFSYNTSVTDHDDGQTDDNHTKSSTITSVQSAKK